MSERLVFNLLEEGYELLVSLYEKQKRGESKKKEWENISDLIQSLKKPVTFLENLVESINEHFAKTNKLFQPDLIDSTFKVGGFVDVAEKLEDYKLNLQIDKNQATKIVINKEAVKNAFQDLSQFIRKVYIYKAAHGISSTQTLNFNY